MATCLDALFERVVVGDGCPVAALTACGNGDAVDCFAAKPESLQQLYAYWLEAGAQLIRTHSRHFNVPALERRGLGGHVSELNWKAARIAADAAQGRDVFVAGCVSPIHAAHGATRDDLRGWYYDQMGALFDGGADCLVLEGFDALDELLLAVEVYHNLTNKTLVPILIPPGYLNLAALWEGLRDADAEITGVEADSVDAAVKLLEDVRVGTDDATAVLVPLGGMKCAGSIQRLVSVGAHLILGGHDTDAAAVATAVEAAASLKPVRV